MAERVGETPVESTRNNRVTRDDRVRKMTRWSGYVIAPVLFLAFVSLYGAPGSTELYFAWGISPDLTPLLMGAGYGAGTYFFYRVVTVGEWHRVHVLFPGIAVFTLAMGIATVLHWDAFVHGRPSTWLWVFLYVVTPVLIPALWVYNGRTDPGRATAGDVTEGDADSESVLADVARVPWAVRWTSGVVGVVLTAVVLTLFVRPEPMIDLWPWTVSPLTARVLLGWASVFSVVSIFFLLETRWSAAKIPIESLVIWFGLLLIGFARSWSDVDTANPLLWVVLGAITAYLVGLSALYVLMERR